MTKSQLVGIFYILISSAAWSTAGFFTRVIALDSWTILFWRGIFVGILMLIISRQISGLGFSENIRRMAGAGWTVCVISAVAMIAFINSLYHTSVANVAIIYATIPFLSAFLAWVLLREKPSFKTLFYSLVAFVGILVVVGKGNWGTGLLGDTLALFMTLSLAIMLVLIRKYQNVPMMFAGGLSSFLCAALILPMASPLDVLPEDMAWLLFFATLQALGFIFFILAAKKLSPPECALVSTIETPLAPLWVWLAFSEIPVSTTLIGGSIVMISVLAYLGSDLRKASLAR